MEGRVDPEGPTSIVGAIGKVKVETAPNSGEYFNRWALNGGISPRAAVTTLEVLAYDPSDSTTLVRLQPITGRGHQVRVGDS